MNELNKTQMLLSQARTYLTLAMTLKESQNVYKHYLKTAKKLLNEAKKLEQKEKTATYILKLVA